MKRTLASALRRFGTTVKLHRPDGTTVSHKAIFQPVTSKSVQAMQKSIPAGGVLEPGQYLYIGAADVQPTQDDTLECAGRKYRLRRCEAIYFRDAAAFYWALCTPDGREIVWP